MTVWRTSELGWKSGQDVSDELARLVEIDLEPGDTLFLDGMYRVSGTGLRLPADFTLDAQPGGGFEIQDAASTRNALFELGDRNTLKNVTFAHVGANTQKKTISARNADDVIVTDTKFVGDAGIFIDVVFSDNLTIQDSHFSGGRYQVRLLGDVANFKVDGSLFEGASHDGIKTVRTGDVGTVGAVVTNSVFENNKRDGIDTTGGFKDGVVDNVIFRNNGVSGMDIKTPFNSTDHLNAGADNTNIVVRNSQFIDNPSAIVTTTNDNVGILTAQNVDRYAVNNVRLVDSIAENTGARGNVRVFLIKDSHNVYGENVKLLGDVDGIKVSDGARLDVPGWGSYDYGLINESYGPARSPSIEYPFPVGPDYASVDPAQSPVIEDALLDEDVVEEEAPAGGSGLLSVKLAYADTDKTVATLADGLVLDAIEDGRKLAIYAIPADATAGIESVKLELEGVGSRVESVAPYALFGDRGGDFAGEALAPGEYALTLTAYGEDGGKGAALGSTGVSFTIADPAAVVEAPTAPEPQPEQQPEPEQRPEPDPVADPVDEKAGSGDGGLLDVKLAYADTDEAFAAIDDGAVVAPTEAGRDLAIYAVARDGAPSIGSVKLDLEGVGSQIESVTPYALFGDRGGDLAGEALEAGDYSLTLTAYSETGGKGSVLGSTSMTFTIAAPEAVAEASPAGPEPVEDTFVWGTDLLDVQLAFADDDRAFAAIGDGSVVDLANQAGREIAIFATAKDDAPKVGSVRLELDGGPSQLENMSPFALFGDRSGDFAGEKFDPGDYRLKLTAYSESRGRGEVLETDTLAFTLVVSDGALDAF